MGNSRIDQGSVMKSTHCPCLRGVVYKTAAQQQLFADFYLPQAAGSKPAVLVVHGGGWNKRSGDMEWICRALAKAGFVAVNITYRLAPTHHFPEPLEDVRDALKWLRAKAQKYEIDPDRIAGWGYSAGANLILLAGLDPSFGFKALVAGGTPADLTAWPKSHEVIAYLGQSFASNPDLWREASPINHVRTSSPPVFLYHGALDWIVNIKQFQAMDAALKKDKVDHDSYTPSFMGHIWTYFFSQESFNRGLNFLRQRMN